MGLIRCFSSPCVIMTKFSRLNWGFVPSLLRRCLTKLKHHKKVREANHYPKISMEICSNDFGLHVWVLNWCLNCIIGCVLNCARILGSYMWEQVRNLVFSPRRVALAWAKTLENPSMFLCETSPKRAEVAWARDTLVQANQLSLSESSPIFLFCPRLEPHSGEIDSPKRHGLSPGLDFLAWARTTAVGCLMFYFKGCNYMFKYDLVQLTFYMLGMSLLILWVVNWMNMN